MTKFVVVGTISVTHKPESYVSCVGDTPEQAAEGWYYLSCGYNKFEPKSPPQCAHHEMLIDACHFLKTNSVGETISILGGDETLMIMEIPEFPKEAIHRDKQTSDCN